MTNFFGQLLKDIYTQLKTQVPELRWIDQDFGQLEIFQVRPSVSFPCALIDFQQTSYSNMSQLAQAGDLTITVRLGFAPFSASNQLAPDDVKDKALAYYDIEQKVYKALQGFVAKFENVVYTSPFIRIAAQTEQRLSASGAQDASGIRVRVLVFNVQFEDYSAEKKYTPTVTNLEVQQEIIL